MPIFTGPDAESGEVAVPPEQALRARARAAVATTGTVLRMDFSWFVVEHGPTGVGGHCRGAENGPVYP